MYNSRMRNSRMSKSGRGENGFEARDFVNYYVNEKEIEIWKQIFDIFDTDEDGVLIPKDLLEAMGKYNGYHPKRNRIFQVMSLYDIDESGSIDFKEFLKMVFEKPCERDTSEDIKKVFHEIDVESKGYIDEQDLRNLASELKEQMNEEEIQIIMRKLDPKRTGKISLTAFIDFNREKINN